MNFSPSNEFKLHMKNIEQKTRSIQDEIQITQIKTIMDHGFFIFFAWFSATSVVVLALWSYESYSVLILWFITSNIVGSVRLLIYRHFKRQLKTISTAGISRIKLIFLIDGLITGLSLGMGNLLFIDPEQPFTLLAMSLTTYFGAMGIMFLWFNYLPAVTAFMTPAGITLITPLILQKNENVVGFGLIILVSVACGVVACFRLRKIYSTTLKLNLENITLSQKHDQARKLAEQASIAKTRFFAAASHDLRQPIHALNLFFAELSGRAHKDNQKLIVQMGESINAVNSMLSALLDVSKLDADIIKPNIEPIELTEMFMRLESEFSTIAKENHNTLRIRHTRETTLSDPLMLERIMRNLINNALRYTKNGRVLVAARPYGDNILMLICDTGIGIPKNQLEEIFVEFHQIDNPERDRRQGLGLGLAIVKRLANLLNHEIKVTSKLGHGSCFSITVPRVCFTRKTATTPYIDHAVEFFFQGNMILILDDDTSILEGMRGLLTYWGCKVITSTTSVEVLRRIQIDRIKPNLLIIDYRLAENESGIEIARKIQNQFSFQLPVILLTGDTSPDRLQEAVSSGFQLLHKPVQIPELRSTMQNLLTKNSIKRSLN